MSSFPYMVLSVWAIVLYNRVYSLDAPGTFGWKNRFQCACQNRSCDQHNGSCATGCRQGRYGYGCQLESDCMYDRTGVHYTGSLDEAEDGRKCLHWAEHSRHHFLQGDDPANFCRNRKISGGYAQRPWCLVTKNGTVTFAFCAIRKCDCPIGLYGSLCQLFCHCRNQSEPCHGVSGACYSGCADGWIGLDCQTKCNDGEFGRNCNRKCNICPNGSCDPETGKCVPDDGIPSHPAPLYQCPDGYFGDDCLHKCHCLNRSEACHKVTGSCTSGCAQTWTEPNCSKALDQGSSQTKETPKALIVIITTGVLGAVIVMLVIGSVLYCRSRRRRGRPSERDTTEVEPTDKAIHVNQESNTLSDPVGTAVDHRDTSCQKRERRKKLRSQTLPNPTPSESFFQPSSFFRSSQDLPRVFSTFGGFDIFGTACDEPGTSQYEHCYGAIRNWNDGKNGSDVSPPRNEDGSGKDQALKTKEEPVELKNDNILIDTISEVEKDTAGQNIFVTVAEIESHAIPKRQDNEYKTHVTAGSESDDTACSNPVKTREGGERSKRVRITEYLDKSFWT